MSRTPQEEARRVAHELHPVQMARCDCDGGVTRAPGAWCAKVTATLTPYLEALEVAREALGRIEVGDYDVPEDDDECYRNEAGAALARIAALTPVETLAK